MDLFNVTLQAGGIGVPFTMVGRYLRVLEAEAPVRVRTNTGIESQILPGLGGDLSDPVTAESFTRFDLASDVTQTVQVLVSTFPVTDNRIVGTIKALAAARENLVALPKLDFVAAGQKTIPGNLARGRLDLVASPSNTGTLWVGGTSAGEGIPLPARATYQLEVAGDLVVYGDTAGDVLHVAEVV